MTKKGKDKVIKVTSWKQLKEIGSSGQVYLNTPDGIFEIEIQALSRERIDEINTKYDGYKEKEKKEVPRYYNKKTGKFEEDTEHPDYEKYQERLRAIESLRIAELALAFMVIKPDGETLEEQIKEMNQLGAGHYAKIMEAGLELSGFELDKKVEAAKNS
ncbi:MAG: hypothetical protein WCS33_05265 [Candidatus Caldatribacteriota bacterium]